MLPFSFLDIFCKYCILFSILIILSTFFSILLTNSFLFDNKVSNVLILLKIYSWGKYTLKIYSWEILSLVLWKFITSSTQHRYNVLFSISLNSNNNFLFFVIIFASSLSNTKSISFNSNGFIIYGNCELYIISWPIGLLIKFSLL